MIVTELECPDCGGPAVVSEDGVFGEDSVDRCAFCGHPGTVFVDEGLDGDLTARFSTRDACDAGCLHDADGLMP